MPLSNDEIEAIQEFERIGAHESQRRNDEWQAQVGNPNFQAARYRLIYVRIDGDGGLRARSADADPLIDLTENEQHLYDSAHIVDQRGHLIYEPSLGREIVQLETPPLDELGWWRDEDGYWHQEPC